MGKDRFNHLNVLYINLKALGIQGALQWTVYRARRKWKIFPPQTFRVRPRGFSQPIELRAIESSDADAFGQVFLASEYESLPAQQPTFILDLGANIGLSSAWFLNRYPLANVLAVEPDPDNFALCCKNLAMFGKRAKVLLGAAWSKRTELSLSRGSFRDGREWASQVVERVESDARVRVEGWDIPSMLTLAGVKVIDLLKVDIERSELELFSKGARNWLSFVRTICIELHGTDCEEVFFGALRDFDFELSHTGELTICENLRLSGTDPKENEF